MMVCFFALVDRGAGDFAAEAFGALEQGADDHAVGEARESAKF